MDYKPRQSYKGSSYTYKKKRIFWFNSAFNDDFTVVDGKIDDITFNVPQFQTYKNNNLKLLTFVREDTNAKPIIIKLKEPYLTSRSVINTDKENYPIIYANHTGCEGMTSKGNNFDLTPQQIPKFVFKFDDTINKLTYNSYFSSITNASLSQVAGGSPEEKILIFKSSGSFVLSRNLTCDILIVGGGGGGGGCLGGGGGAGQVLYTTNLNLSLGTYTITVGAGGAGGTGLGNSTALGSNGGDSSIIINGITYTAKGGGGGGYRSEVGYLGNNGVDGGSGGGGSHTNTGAIKIGGSSTKNDYSNWISLGNSGGKGITFDANNPNNKHLAGGGGGAGSSGSDAYLSDNKIIGYSGNGGLGVNLSSIFGSSVGVSGGLFAGGGGGSVYYGDSNVNIGIGNAGGGNGGNSSNGINGLANTGSGGGGGGHLLSGGTGGSGIVIIKFRETRINGITAGETLVQATNSSIAVVENSKYLINYQNPTNIQTGTYETIFSNGFILFRNKKFPRPWGAYFAEDWSGTTLLDSSGNGRHATTSGGTIVKASGFGNGANGNINYISGGTGDRITWPSGSIPTTYTILGLTRYTGGWKRRILQGSANWLQGHWDANVNPDGIRGIAFNTTAFLTPQTSVGNITDWLCSITKNSGTTPNNAIMDGIGRGIATSASGGYILGINSGAFGVAEASDWAMSVVLIWDTALSDAQMFELNRLIDDYKNTGRSIKNDLGLNFDYSYPILKDANGDTINPYVWYKLDANNLLIDSSGNNNHLVNVGTGGTSNTSTFAKGNGSAYFNGSANYFINSVSFAGRDVPISFSFWFNPNITTEYSTLVSLNNNAGFATIQFDYNGSANTLSVYTALTNQWTTSPTKTGLVGNTWYHVVYTLNNNNPVGVKLYVNGVLASSGTGNLNQTLNANRNFIYLGYAGDLGRGYAGYIDDFRMYALELSATQVSELYNGRISIYNPPNFEIGLEMNDVDLIVDNTISPYL